MINEPTPASGDCDADAFCRLDLLVGSEGMRLLGAATVTVFGVGGVGSHAVDALVRAGVRRLTLVDFDTVNASNINRQTHATHLTLGQPKVAVMAAHLRAVNPEIELTVHQVRVTAESAGSFLTPPPDFVLDAIDDTAAKIGLLACCVRAGVRVVSAMGAANKLRPEAIHVGDISESSQCPLARVIRKRLRRQGIHRGITVVYSDELPVRLTSGGFLGAEAEGEGQRRPQGTMSYMPALFGLNCAAVIIQSILEPIRFRRRGETPRTGES